MQIRLEELKQGTLSLKFEEPPETFAVLTEMIDSGACEFIGPITAALRAQQLSSSANPDGGSRLGREAISPM